MCRNDENWQIAFRQYPRVQSHIIERDLSTVDIRAHTRRRSKVYVLWLGSLVTSTTGHLACIATWFSATQPDELLGRISRHTCPRRQLVNAILARLAACISDPVSRSLRGWNNGNRYWDDDGDPRPSTNQTWPVLFPVREPLVTLQRSFTHKFQHSSIITLERHVRRAGEAKWRPARTRPVPGHEKSLNTPIRSRIRRS